MLAWSYLKKTPENHMNRSSVKGNITLLMGIENKIATQSLPIRSTKA